MKRRAVITGLGPITCIGKGVEGFWNGILSEKSGINRISTFDTSDFYAQCGGEIRDWANEHRLPVDENKVQFPDFRVEHEWPDGRRDIEDVEITTPHYRGAHAASKARAGFTTFRSGGSRVGGNSKGGGGRTSDPHLAEEFLG